MTEIQALKESMELWKWLSENPKLDKIDYPEFKGKIDFYRNKCPLCQIYREDEKGYDGGNCGECILRDNHDPENDEICCKEFYQWIGSDKNGEFKVSKKDKIKYATIIYEKIKTRYEKLDKGEIK